MMLILNGICQFEGWYAIEGTVDWDFKKKNHKRNFKAEKQLQIDVVYGPALWIFQDSPIMVKYWWPWRFANSVENDEVLHCYQSYQQTFLLHCKHSISTNTLQVIFERIRPRFECFTAGDDARNITWSNHVDKTVWPVHQNNSKHHWTDGPFWDNIKNHFIMI